MKKLKKDVIDFFKNDSTQKLLLTFALMFFLRVLGYMPEKDFVTIIRWAIIGFWGANAADYATNIRR